MQQNSFDLYTEYLSLCSGTAPIPDKEDQISSKCQEFRRIALIQARLLKDIAALSLDDKQSMDKFSAKHSAAMNNLQTCDYSKMIQSIINSWAEVTPDQAVSAAVTNAVPTERSTLDLFIGLMSALPDNIDFADIL